MDIQSDHTRMDHLHRSLLTLTLVETLPIRHLLGTEFPLRAHPIGGDNWWFPQMSRSYCQAGSQHHEYNDP